MTILETFIKLRDDLKLWVTNNLKTKADKDHIHDEIKVCEATPDTLTDIVANAQSNTTIQLTAGTYDLLTLRGKDSYPENLTIVGCDGAVVRGVSITSGVESLVAYDGVDIELFKLSEGFTLKNLTLSDSFSLRNGVVDNLSIVDCHFTSGGINIAPNEFVDIYDSDVSEGASNTHHYEVAGLKIHNVNIKGCTFDDASIRSEETAIFIASAENIEANDNKIIKAAYNGIQINGSSGQPSSGKIRILNNGISNTYSRAIRINNLENAELYVMENNMFSINTGETNSEYIKASNLVNTVMQWSYHDYEGANWCRDKIDRGDYSPGRGCLYVDDGITVTGLESDLNAIESTEYPSCYYRMVDGEKEWLNPPMEDGIEYRTTERFSGKPVYTMSVNGGKMPYNNYKDISFSAQCKTLVETSVFIYDADLEIWNPLPYVNYSSGVPEIWVGYVGLGAVRIQAKSPQAYSEFYFIVKYTKS